MKRKFEEVYQECLQSNGGDATAAAAAALQRLQAGETAAAEPAAAAAGGDISEREAARRAAMERYQRKLDEQVASDRETKLSRGTFQPRNHGNVEARPQRPADMPAPAVVWTSAADPPASTDAVMAETEQPPAPAVVWTSAAAPQEAPQSSASNPSAQAQEAPGPVDAQPDPMEEDEPAEEAAEDAAVPTEATAEDIAKLALAVRAGKKLSRDEQAAAFEACARRLKEWEELNGSVLQTMNMLSVRGMQMHQKLAGAQPEEPEADPSPASRTARRPPDAPLTSREDEGPRSFLIKRGTPAEASPKPASPMHVDASGTIGSAQSKEEMMAARAARLLKLEQDAQVAKEQSKDAERKAKAREAMFESSLNWRTGPGGTLNGR